MAKAPYFKAGDTLLVPITFEDTATNLGITLDDALEVSARIVDERNKLISDVQVTKDPDQTTYPGRFLLRVDAEVTALWKPVTAYLDIKVSKEGLVRHSADFKFNIVRRITP